MACLYPKPAYLSTEGKVTFVRHEKALGSSGFIHIRCGMCNGCKADHARDWAIRCYHESQMHHVSCFVTLTYDEEHLPACGSLDKRDLQQFWKALRKKLNVPIRYFAAGEYGTKKGRPHYHAIIFGWMPSKRYPVDISDKGHIQYTHPILQSAWQKRGRIVFTDFDPSCARYVAHYTADKLKSYAADTIDPETGLRPYEKLDKQTGEIWQLQPEFQVSSLKPAIGLRWLEKYWMEVFPKDTVIMDGKEYPPPRFYYKWLAENQESVHQHVRQKRIEQTRALPYERGIRLHQKAQAINAKLTKYKRPTHDKEQQK